LNPQTLDIRGVAIDFPFEPYPTQCLFMERVIEGLQERCNALLESPTGTGKTMCLLCAALAWQQTFAAGLLAGRSLGELLSRADSSKREELLPSVREELDAFMGAIGEVRLRPLEREPGDTLSLPGIGKYTYSDGPSSGVVPPPADSPHPLIGAAVRGCRAPQIVFASRTHSQLSQVIREVKRSAYRPKVTVMASREQLCVHPKVSKLSGSQQGFACRARCRERQCAQRNTLEDWTSQGRSVHELHRAVGTPGSLLLRMPTDEDEKPASSGSGQEALLDVEELASLGRSKGFCPYFAMRDSTGQQQADLVLIPYNYLVDPEVRRSLSINWNEAIVIVDEAHNLESIAAEAASFDFTPADFAMAQREVHMYLEGILGGQGGVASALSAAARSSVHVAQLASVVAGSTGAKVSPDQAARLKTVINAIEAEIAHTSVPPPPSPGFVAEGNALSDVFERFGIVQETWDRTKDILDGIIEWLMERADLGGRARDSQSVLALEKLKRMIAAALRVSVVTESSDTAQASLARRVAAATASKYFRMVIHQDQRTKRTDASKPVGNTLSYWCFSPGVAVSELMQLGVRSVVLTSGTLSPMDSYAAELQMPFPVRLENPHVVDPDQLFVAIVGSGPCKKNLNSSYQNRESIEYKDELGNSIRNIVRIVPDGVLVFFPSYGVMESCIGHWKSHNGGATWTSLCGLKHVVVEARSPGELPAQMKEYQGAVDSGRGGLFFAVCRGKVSEGLDFTDAYGRAVVVTGLPYPPSTDPKVVLKQRYLDDAVAGKTLTSSGDTLLTGREWYNQQATRAVNQAIGRVIRHRHDWGAILLLDSRFVGHQTHLSSWLRESTQVIQKWPQLVAGLTEYLARNHSAAPVLRVPVSSASATAEERKSLSPTLKASDVELLTSLVGTRPASEMPVAPTEVFLGSGVPRALEGQSVASRRAEAFASLGPRTNLRTFTPSTESGALRVPPKTGVDAFIEELKQSTSEAPPPRPSAAPAALAATSGIDQGQLGDVVERIRSVTKTDDSLTPEQVHSNKLRRQWFKAAIRKLLEAPDSTRKTAVVRFARHVAAVLDLCPPPLDVGVDTAKLVPLTIALREKAATCQTVSRLLKEDHRALFTAELNALVRQAREQAQKRPRSDPTPVPAAKQSRLEVPPPPPSSTTTTPSSSPGIVCKICFEMATEMLAPRCGHVCCRNCWDKALSSLAACPTCRAPVTSESLIVLH
jgi:regulator of telomere elongation helicase 1